MNSNKNTLLKVQSFVFFIYFILTTLVFVIAAKWGNTVSLQVFGGGDDGVFYWEQAQNLVAGKAWIMTSIYPLIIGNMIKITGINSVYLVRMFNYFGFVLLALFSMSLVNIQFQYGKNPRISQNTYNAKTLLLLAFLLYPSLLSLNLSIYRDIWIYLFYVLSTYLTIKIMFFKERRFIDIVMLVFSLGMLGAFRGYALFSYILGLAIYLFSRKMTSFIRIRSLILSAFFLFGIYYTFLIDFSIFNISLERALDYRASFIDIHPGGSQMWISLNGSNYILFLINYLHSYMGNLLGPLPWQISGIPTLLVFLIESIPMFLILRYLWKKKNQLTQVQKYILLQAFVWIAFIGITNDNLGAATRLRAIGWILFIIVFVVVYSNNMHTKKILGKC